MRSQSIDLSDDAFLAQVPHEVLAYLREHEPVWWWPEGECWVVTGYELVVQMNRDFTRYSSAGGVVPPGPNLNPSVLLAMDPPLHTEYRRMVIRSFVPRAVAALESEIRSIALEAVEDYAKAGGGDFVEDVATAIPFRVMADLTGIPRSAEKLVMGWSQAIGPNSDPEYRPEPTSMQDAQEGLSAFLGEQFEERRRNPGSDLFSDLLKIEYQGKPLCEEDLRGFGINYLLGGTETTRNLIAQGLRELLDHPKEMRRFVDGEVSTEAMVEEMLRFVTPVMHHSRWATDTQRAAGQTIQSGDRVTLWMAAANRDPAIFENPATLDLGRDPNPHIALGSGGPHFCLGAHLARLETVLTFEALRPHLASLTFAGPPERVCSNFINGMKHLPLALVEDSCNSTS